MKSNWRSSLTALNQQMKHRYDANHLEYLPQWKAHFIRVEKTPTKAKDTKPPSYEQLGASAAEMTDQQHSFAAEMTEKQQESSQDTTKSFITEPPKENVGSVEEGANGNEEIRPQDILRLLAQMETTHAAHLRAIQDNFAQQQKQFSEAMQQQQSANKNMQEQLKKVQEQRRVASSGKTLGGEGGGAGGLESQFPFNPSFTSGSEAKLGGSITGNSQPSPTQPPPTQYR